MELHIIDRLAIPALLPKEGNFKQYNLKKSILSKIEIGEQEREEVNLRQNPETNRIEWDTEKDNPLTVSFSDEEMQFLKESFRRAAPGLYVGDYRKSVRCRPVGTTGVITRGDDIASSPLALQTVIFAISRVTFPAPIRRRRYDRTIGLDEAGFVCLRRRTGRPFSPPYWR